MTVWASIERLFVKVLVVAALAGMVAVALHGAARTAAASVTLVVSDIQTPPGTTVSIPVELDNPNDEVRGLQFTVVPSSAVTYVDVHAVERGVGLTAEANQQSDGSIIVVLISLGTQAIAPGSGRILTLDATVTPAVAGDLITLDLANVRVAGLSAPLVNTTQSGHIRIEAAAPAGGGSGGGGGGGGCTLARPAGHGASGILLGVVAALLWRCRRFSQ